MTAKVSPLGLRLFMEGVEVPVIAASVTVQPDMPATAAIQIIPTDMSLHFLPRTLVHLFYLDTALTDEDVMEAKKVSDITGAGRTKILGRMEAERYEMNDFAYKLLFAGEVIGFNYKKTPAGRQLVLQCMDLSSYWDTCYQFFSDYSAGGNGLTDKYHHFVGAGEGLFDNLGGPDWVMANLITSAPKSPEYQNCTGLQGGLIHLLEAVGGIRYRASNFPGYKGVNDFFTIAELRYGLLSMLGAIEADKSSAKLFACKAFHAWLRQGMTSIGNLISFRDMLNHLNRHIFHNIYPNPCAHYVPGGNTTSKRTVKIGTTAVLDTVMHAGTKEALKIANVSLNKVIGNFDSILEAEAISGSLYSDAKQNLTEVDDILSEAMLDVDISKNPDAKATAADLIAIESIVQQAMSVMSETDISTITQAKDLTVQAATNLDELIGKQRARFKTEEIKVPKASFLYNQLFLPEVFFVSPPRCNIIFPDQYFDLTFSRNFMREVTRLSCQSGLGIIGGGRKGASIFGSTYLAPKVKDVMGRLLGVSLSQGSKILLPHEVHSGIIPKFEWVSDGQRWGAKAQKGRINKVNFLQRLANFQFFLHRWSARQLTITGVFNPNIVAGFPGVIIDRSAPSPAVVERLEKVLMRRMLPTQFVGKVYGYTHSIGQQGGSTTVQFTYARTHRGLDDEFLGVLSREIKEEGKDTTFEVSPRQLATGVDPAEVQESGTGTEQTETDKAKTKQKARTGANIELRKDVVRRWLAKKLSPTAMVPGLGKVRSAMGIGASVLTKEMSDTLGIPEDYFTANLHPAPKSSAGVPGTGDVDVIDIPETISVIYAPILGTGKFERTGLAFEDAVRPSWMDEDIWHSKKITEKVYKQLIGSLAITDDAGLGQDQQDELLKRWTTDQQKRIESTETKKEGDATVTVESVDNVYKFTVVPGSIEESIDGLSLIYGMIKEKGGDLHQFIQDFTRRPIANMIDILGSQNLEFDELGLVANPATMIEGFHSRAFGDYNTDVQLPEKEGSSVMAGKNALGALMEGVKASSVLREGIVGLKDDPPAAVKPEYDPRGRARGRVIAYVEELQVSRGLLGS